MELKITKIFLFFNLVRLAHVWATLWGLYIIMSDESYHRHYALCRTNSYTSASSVLSVQDEGSRSTMGPKMKVFHTHIPVARLSFRCPKKVRKGVESIFSPSSTTPFISPPLTSLSINSKNSLDKRKERKFSAPNEDELIELKDTLSKSHSAMPLQRPVAIPSSRASRNTIFGHKKLSRAPPLMTENYDSHNYLFTNDLSSNLDNLFPPKSKDAFKADLNSTQASDVHKKGYYFLSDDSAKSTKLMDLAMRVGYGSLKMTKRNNNIVSTEDILQSLKMDHFLSLVSKDKCLSMSPLMSVRIY